MDSICIDLKRSIMNFLPYTDAKSLSKVSREYHEIYACDLKRKFQTTVLPDILHNKFFKFTKWRYMDLCMDNNGDFIILCPVLIKGNHIITGNISITKYLGARLSGNNIKRYKLWKLEDVLN